MARRFGRNGYWRWRYQVTRVENAARRALRALLGPARVGTSALAKLSETCLPFSQARGRVLAWVHAALQPVEATAG